MFLAGSGSGDELEDLTSSRHSVRAACVEKILEKIIPLRDGVVGGAVFFEDMIVHAVHFHMVLGIIAHKGS